MDKTPFKMPLVLVILDGLGAILLGLGAAKYFANIDILPAKFQFESYAIVLMFAGGLLMLPMLTYVVNKIRENSERSLHK
jgi:uncharacterized membrane protein YidH (DUF202 family)